MPWWSSSSSDPASQGEPPTPLRQPSSALPPPSQALIDPDFYAAHPHLAPPSLAPTSSVTQDQDVTLDPTLPRTMSCRAAFDSAFYCSSFGGHFNDIYRYGQLRSCSDHWSDFWFCMRTNSSYNGREVKEQLVQERYRDKEEKIRSGPNSEDVWSRRREGDVVFGAFGRKESR